MSANRAAFTAMLRGERRTPVALGALLSLASTVNRAGMLRRLSQTPVRLDVPVVSVGNLTLGGTGKTPAVIERALAAVAEGHRPVVVTRGYHAAKTEEPLLLPPGAVLAAPSRAAAEAARRFGDEAALVAWRVPGCAVAKGRDRVRAAQAAIAEFGCDLVLLDDGYQYVRLARDANVLLVDATCPFGNRRIFPSGYLREPLHAAARATELLITHADLGMEVESLEEELRVLCPDVSIRRTWHAPVALVRLSDGAEMPLEDLAGTEVRPLCGVGNPAAFLCALEGLGAQLCTPIILPDHASRPAALKADGPPFVMTEKDAIKLDVAPENAFALRIALRPWGSA